MVERRGRSRVLSGKRVLVILIAGLVLCGLSLYRQAHQVRGVFEQEVDFLSHGFLDQDDNNMQEPLDEEKERLQALAAENFLHDGVREAEGPMTVVTNAPKPPDHRVAVRPPRRKRRRRGPPRQASLARSDGSRDDFEAETGVSDAETGELEADVGSSETEPEVERQGPAPDGSEEEGDALPFTGEQADSIMTNLTYIMGEDAMHKLFASQSTIGETHSGSSKKGTHKVSLSEAQRELVPEDGKPSRRFRTCALVGNARSLLKKSHGADIDAHDAVMRLNQATTVGFEKHVGKKTTFRLINSKWAQAYTSSNKLQLEKDVTLVVSRTDWRAFLRIAGKLRHKRRDVASMLLSREAVNSAGNTLRELKRRMEAVRGEAYPGKGSPSSGWVGTYFLLQMCDSLDIYGVGTTAFKEKVPNWHYFENHRFHSSREFGSDPHHSFALEHEALLLFHREKIVAHHP